MAIKRRSGLVAALLWTLIPAAHATAPARWLDLSDAFFQQYSKDSGLPHPIVTAVAEDGDGFLWMGTLGGIARFDGYRFHTYTPNPGDPTALPDNFITTLHTDTRGRLWVGTNAGGLARYDRDQDRFVTYGAGPNGLDNAHVTGIADDGDNGLWVATGGGLTHLDPQTGALQTLHHDPHNSGSLPDDRVRAVLRGRDGTLWVGMATGLVRGKAGAVKFQSVPLPANHGQTPAAISLFEDEGGRIWVGTRGNGAYYVDPKSALAHPLEDSARPDPTLCNDIVLTIAAAGPGEIWFGTADSGIVTIDSQTGRTHRIRHDPATPKSLAHNQVLSLFRDRAGSIWVGGNGGVGRVANDQKAFLTVAGAGAQAGGVADLDVNAVLATASDKVWLGFAHGGVDILDPTSGQVTALRPESARSEKSLPSAIVNALAASNDGVYIATLRGLYRADMSGRFISRIDTAQQHVAGAISSLLLDNGILWVASAEDGLNDISLPARNPPAGPAVWHGQLTDDRIVDIAKDTQGALWIATYNGLNRYDPVTRAIDHILPDPADPASGVNGYVSSLLIDHQGRLWIGLMGSGVALLTDKGVHAGQSTAASWHFRHIGISDGLPNANVDKLLEDQQGRIWASTDDGLAVIDPESFAVQPLRAADGVAILNYWSNSGSMTAAGELLFGGQGGLTVVRPERLQPWHYRPPVVVTDLRIGGRPVASGRFNGAGSDQPLVVPASANSLAVEFSALDYTAPERNKYAYKLDGFDRDWIETDSTRRLAAYTNLPPGEYRLRLRGSNREGAWSETSLTLPIKVVPAWYQTWWFKLVLTAIGGGAVLALVQMRTAFLRQRQRQLENEVAERTADLHRSLLTIAQKSDRIASLLDNSGEGFLSFGATLVVDPDYSRACEIFLGTSPAGHDAADVLFADDPQNADLLRKIVPKTLQTADPQRRELLLTLFPTEFCHPPFQCKAQYSVIENDHIMVVLKDITEERSLAEKVASERRGLEMIVAAVTDSHDFFSVIDAYRDFVLSDLPDLLAKTTGISSILREFYRQIHTFKGSLAQFSFDRTPKALHDLESRLGLLLQSGSDHDPSPAAVNAIAWSVPYMELLDADLTTIREALGDIFLERGSLVVLSIQQAMKIKDLALNLLLGRNVDTSKQEMRQFLREIRNLGNISLRETLQGFNRSINQAAERQEKMVAPLVVEGGADIWLDPQKFGPFLRSLVHVFRNAVAHGLEGPDQRLQRGKDQTGHISCTINSDHRFLLIAITDDGAGIDLDLLRRKSVDLGLFAESAIADVADARILDLIFRDNFSIQETVDTLAGRGVGLAAVRSEVAALGGTVTVRTEPGQGCQFLFTLPLPAEMTASEAAA